jgi:intein/homing endonuclease
MNGYRGKFENYEIAHFRLQSDSNFLPYGKCVRYDTFIDTPNGQKQIQDIVPGDSVLTVDVDTGHIISSSVVAQICSGEKSLLRIETRHTKIDVSEDHQVLTAGADDLLVYKLAKDIELGDILVQRHAYINPTINSDLDVQWAQFLGFMVGDGWIAVTNYQVAFADGIDEDLNKVYFDLLTSLSGNTPRRTVPIKGSSGGQTYIYSKEFSSVLAEKGFVSNGAVNKKVPEWIFAASDAVKLAFVRGLVDADGSTNIDRFGVTRYQIEVVSEPLLHGTKQLLRSLGIKSSNIRTRRGGRTSICGISCNSMPSNYIYFYIDGQRNEEWSKYRPVNITSLDVKFEPVKKVTAIGYHVTYDIQVDNNNSNFIANGLVVHNSMIENARRPYRQLTMMEDAMMIHRIMRAPEKRVFKVDIGNTPPADIENLMQKLIDKTKKVPFIDQKTGDYNQRYNMQNLLEDFYLPVRGKDSGTSIENLNGLQYDSIDDIEYLRNRMMAGLKIPKAFLGYDENISGGKTLAAEDVRFARTIERIQRVLVSELTKLAIVHLYAQGFKDEQLVSFKLSLTNPSTIYEQEKINLWTQKVGLVSQMQGTKMFSSDWMYSNVFDMPEDEYDVQRQRIIEDAKRMYRVTQVEQGQSDPAKFGYPQDQEPPEEGMEGGAMGGAPAGGAPVPAGGAPMGGGGAAMPQSVDDLPTAAELGLEEVLDEDGRGAPRKGATYAQDSHVRGRDPLGFKERYSAMHVGQKRAPSKKSPLSLESMYSLSKMNKKGTKILQEESDGLDGTYMDEKNIL